MRKPRSPMKVDTFPFLAVLLCAMAALIVVLLVMDRKARQVAQSKASRLASSQQARCQEESAQRFAQERLLREAALAEWQAKHEQLQKRLAAEQAQLQAELLAARQRAADATRLLEKEAARLETVRTQLVRDIEKLAQVEKQLAQANKAHAEALQRLQAAKTARSLSATQIQALERALAQAKRPPAPPDKTFSLVPYGGKRGVNSRPVYVECCKEEVLFHPDKKKIAATQPHLLRDEAVRRLEARGKDAYLMILLRPDGIETYYALRKAVDDLEITFGYEMMDADWHLDLSREPAPTQRADSSAAAQEFDRQAAKRPLATPGPVGTLVELPSVDTSAFGEGPKMGKPLPRPPGPLGLPSLSPPLVPGMPPNHAQPLPSSASSGSPTATQPDQRSAMAPAPAPQQKPATSETAATTRIQPKKPASQKPPLQPVRLENDEVTVFVECYTDSVVVYPSKKSFGLASFRSGSFVSQVKQGLSRPLLGGGTPKLQIRFLIRPGGERMLHSALEQLRPLRVPMSQYRIQPEDDVQQIVSQR